MKAKGVFLTLTLCVGFALYFFSHRVLAEELLLKLGEFEITYDSTLEADTNANGTVDRLTYYSGALMAVTAYDENEDGEYDLWFLYDRDGNVAVEFSDSNGNGKLDKEVKIDSDERSASVIPLEKEAVISGPLVWFVVLLCVVVLFVRSKTKKHLEYDS